MKAFPGAIGFLPDGTSFDLHPLTTHLAFKPLHRPLPNLDTGSLRATLTSSRPGASPNLRLPMAGAGEGYLQLTRRLSSVDLNRLSSLQPKHWLRLSKAPASEGGEHCPLYPLEKE